MSSFHADALKHFVEGDRFRHYAAAPLTVGLGAMLLAAFVVIAPPPAAAAVIYCTGPGYPVGCVARPTAPAARAVVHCTRPGYPVGCTPGADAAARAVVRPGPGVNLGGPVNRPGLR